MYGGGVTINERTAQVLRTAGLMMPIALFFYGLLVHFQLVDDSHYTGIYTLIVLMIPWTVLAFLQFTRPSTTMKSVAIRLVTYHIFSGLYIILISGFGTPFIATWTLLMLAAYAYFSHSGLKISALILIATAAIDSTLYIEASAIVTTNLLACTAVLIVSLIAIAISRIQEVDGAELSRSKALEVLQRDRILTIVNNLADAILSTDKNGIIRVYNAASLNLLDTNSSLNGKFIDDILMLNDRENRPVSIFDNLKESRGVVVRDDVTMTIADETLRLELTYSPIRSSYSKTKRAQAQDGYILILRDVTKAKSLEEERDEFISVVSHELRTPITITEGTISNVQVMMDRKDISQDALKQSIANAHDQVVFLARMVNDLSTLSRAERGVADTPEAIDVKQLVKDLYDEYAPQAETKGLIFNLDIGPRLGHLSVSRLYLKELLQNFITNALKYTKEGTITLRTHRHDDAVEFEVIDTGIGISKSDQVKVFNKFYRSEDYRTRETGGTGLGLYVAAKLARKLKTKIVLQSRLNHGSSFKFTITSKDA